MNKRKSSEYSGVLLAKLSNFTNQAPCWLLLLPYRAFVFVELDAFRIAADHGNRYYTIVIAR